MSFMYRWMNFPQKSMYRDTFVEKMISLKDMLVLILRDLSYERRRKITQCPCIYVLLKRTMPTKWY